jgi:hypothetical protein
MFPVLPIAGVAWHPSLSDTIHVANLLYLSSYLVRDILWLRVLSVAAGLSLLPFYWTVNSSPLWEPIAWNVLFASVNLVQIGILVWERRPRRLQGTEQFLHQTVFPELTAGEFLRLVRKGTWRDVAAGELVVDQGSLVGETMIIAEGTMEVRHGDQRIAELRPGQCIGEMSFLSGGRAAGSVVALRPCRVLAWPQPTLQRLLDTDPGLAFKIRAVFSRDVVAKLRAHGGPRTG